MSAETKTALVLGATGGIGSATAEELTCHRWKIRALSPSGAPTDRKDEWDWVKGDSMDRASIALSHPATSSNGANCEKFHLFGRTAFRGSPLCLGKRSRTSAVAVKIGRNKRIRFVITSNDCVSLPRASAARDGN